MCEPGHRHEEWPKFLKLIDRRTPKHLNLNLIVDNYGTHSHPAVQTRLGKHLRLVMHFTPTSASWLNMVERFFRDISENRIGELELAIDLYIADHNADPKHFTWTASAKDILSKVPRVKASMAVTSTGDAGRRRPCSEPGLAMLAGSYGLTLAERRAALVRHATPREIAQAHDVKLSTVRSQISAIRAKFGTRSIDGLLLRAAEVPPVSDALRMAAPAAPPALRAGLKPHHTMKLVVDAGDRNEALN